MDPDAILTFAGAPLAPCIALGRPRRPRRVQRPQQMQSPRAWLTMWEELFGLDRRLAWVTWQAFGTSTYSEVRALAQPVLLWPASPAGLWALPAKGLTPARLMKAVELLVVEGKLTAVEAAKLEECILRKTDRTGQWISHAYKENDDGTHDSPDTQPDSV